MGHIYTHTHTHIHTHTHTHTHSHTHTHTQDLRYVLASSHDPRRPPSNIFYKNSNNENSEMMVESGNENDYTDNGKNNLSHSPRSDDSKYVRTCVFFNFLFGNLFVYLFVHYFLYLLFYFIFH